MSHRPATQKQFSLIKTLLAERQVPESMQHTIEIDRGNAVRGTMTATRASALIDTLFTYPKTTATATPATPEVEDGIYVLAGQYIKVQTSPETGRQYGKQWDVVNHEWAYAGRHPLPHLDASKKATAEQASQFGHLYGQCVFCGRTLTDERSVHVGYGPTCAGHHGLPWGETPEVVVEACCDGTGWTGNMGAPCPTHYEPHNLPGLVTPRGCGCEPSGFRCSTHSREYQNKWGRAENE